MPKKGTVLMKKWLAEWQRLTTSSRWQKGRTLYQQQRLLEVNIAAREIKGVMREGEIHRQRITCGEIEAAELEKCKETFLNDPSLVMLVYLKSTMTGETLDVPLRSLFLMPRVSYSCTCSDGLSVCKHLVALAMAVGTEIDKDPSKFLLFRGVPWNEILQLVGSKQPSYEEEHPVNYSMVPLPPQANNYIPLSRKGKFSPSFWVSPFPFPLIMEEIYKKVGEEKDEDENSD